MRDDRRARVGRTPAEAAADADAIDPLAGSFHALMIEARMRFGLQRLDAQLLVAHHTGRSRTWLLAHEDEPVPGAAAARIRADYARRADAVPMAQLLGRKEFHGLDFRITPDVLVPRPETELLVDWALACARATPTAQGQAPLRVLDLGTGSGAIAVALAVALGAAGRPAGITAVDRSAAALEVARGNAAAHGVSLRLLEGSWYAALHAAEAFELIVSNPPYIDGDDAHLHALRHEPTIALTPGADGLLALREIVGLAPRHLVGGGWLLVEHGHDQGAAVRGLFESAGFTGIETRRDLAGHERATGGQWRPAA